MMTQYKKYRIKYNIHCRYIIYLNDITLFWVGFLYTSSWLYHWIKSNSSICTTYYCKLEIFLYTNYEWVMRSCPCTCNDDLANTKYFVYRWVISYSSRLDENYCEMNTEIVKQMADLDAGWEVTPLSKLNKTDFKTWETTYYHRQH